VEDARDLIGETVLVKLMSNEGLDFAGFPAEGPVFCRIVAVDEIGMWVENRNFVTVEVRTAAGRYVPKQRQKPRRSVATLLVPWRIVHTVVRFAGGETPEVGGAVLGGRSGSGGRIGFVK
jgi:hypothetical protein